MSSHSSLPHDLKKKGLEHPTRDGASGMGSGTKRHFADVKARMAKYAEDQDEWEFDQSHNHDFDDMRDGAQKGVSSTSRSHHKSVSDSKRHDHIHPKPFLSPAPHRHHKSSSTSSPHDSHRKGLEHPPRDGITGMGPRTQRHFAEVKARMEDYCDDQDMHRYDREQAHRPSKPGLITRIDRFFGGEKGIATTHGTSASTHTPTSARKKTEQLNLATPTMTRRGRKAGSVSDIM